MKKDISNVLLPWLLIVVTFFLASLWLNKQSFYLFDLIWRVLIIAGVYFLGNIRLGFPLKQWLAIGLFFCLNFWFVRYFFPSFLVSRIVVNIGLGPFVEEMFFRGWVISKLKGGNRSRIIKSSLLFALYHLKNVYVLTPFALIYQILFTGLVVGPIFGWLRLKYNSLFPVIFLHSLNNMIGSTITEKFLPFIIQRTSRFI